MALRSIGTATISFGLVSIPIKLYSTNKTSSQISFNLIDSETGTRLKQQYINGKGEIVPRSQMVKGYEFSKGRYVTFTDAELKAAEEATSKSIDIVEFVPKDSVPWVFVDKSYYLGPDKGGDKAYQLLGAAMRQTERVAVARYAARGKQYIVMLVPHEQGLAMQQLRYADEVRDFSEVPVGEGKASDSELVLAKQLIDQIANDTFEPEKYEDGVKQRLEAMIEEKVEGKEITAAPEEEPATQIIDLMEALKASLGADGKSGGTKRAAKRVAAKAKSKKKTAKG